MKYSMEELCRQAQGKLFGKKKNDFIEWFLTDSRSMVFPETTLFFALRTEKNDGHKYIKNLYDRGVKNFVVEYFSEGLIKECSEATFILSSNPLKALQKLAQWHRENFSIPIIGITGSNGKTIVKEWLYQLLNRHVMITRSPRSYNSQIGVPLSVCLLNDSAELGIFEAGISRPGEMESLRSIIQPTIGILTNIGQAHQENFKSLHQKCLEKLILFKHANALIYCADDPLIEKCLNELNLSCQRITWSEKKPDAFLYISKIRKIENKTIVNYVHEEKRCEVEIPFNDEASVQNALHCLTCSLYLHFTSEEIRKQMTKLERVAMRLEVKQGMNGCVIINDSYNSDINSLDIALDFLQRRPCRKHMKKVLILSDILQSELSEDELYKKVSSMISRRDVDILIGIGKHLYEAAKYFNIEKYFYNDTESFIHSGWLTGKEDITFLLKGARSFNFESVEEILVQKVHETVLEVDLGGIVENLNHYRSLLRGNTKMVCMVKASAYGAGSAEICKTLQDCGVEYLAVAVADEGAYLRKAGITANIIVMNPELSSFNTLFRYNLEPEIYSFELLESLVHEAEKRGIMHYPAHIKLDTGMHRLGFDAEKDIEQLVSSLKEQSALVPRSVFSHFVGSDSQEFDDFSTLQFQRFDKASQYLQAAFSHKILRHICNSAGIERFPARHLDMVRLGLGLYGINPIDNHILNTVASLKTTILQIHDLEKGETVGYSRRGKINKKSRIATLPIGYADGLNRKLGNGNFYCLVNGRKAYYIGNICMDVCMIDVTDIPCKTGDSVEIFGTNLSVVELSNNLNTIPYEILTTVSNRVRRIYFQS